MPGKTKKVVIPEDLRKRKQRIDTKKDNFLNRENKSIPGFSFDMDAFENLIDNFTPKEDIPLILCTNKDELDKFCKIAYNLNFYDAYQDLNKRALFYDRRAFNNLAQAGNPTAINVVAKYFMKLDEQDRKQELRIRVINSIPNVDDEVEK